MKTIKQLIILLLSLSFIVPYGCAPKTQYSPLVPHITTAVEVEEDLSRSNENNLGRMIFRPQVEQQSNKDLEDVINTCAKLSDVNLTSSKILDYGDEVRAGISSKFTSSGAGVPDLGPPILGSGTGGLTVLLAFPVAFVVAPVVIGGVILAGIRSGVNRYDKKIEKYRILQRCVELSGYICEGFCPTEYEDRSLYYTNPAQNCGYKSDINHSYLAHNIWIGWPDYEEDQISLFCKNYKRGRILPAGTEVINMSINSRLFREYISFTVAKTCETIEVNFKPDGHSGETAEGCYNKMFTDVNYDEITSDFNKEELEALEGGTLEKGMSKNATLATYGYPSQHRITSLNEKTWWYWENASTVKKVDFDENNKIVSIKSGLARSSWFVNWSNLPTKKNYKFEPPELIEMRAAYQQSIKNAHNDEQKQQVSEKYVEELASLLIRLRERVQLNAVREEIRKILGSSNESQDKK